MKNKLITLSQAARTKYYKTIVNVEVHVTGKALLPYQVPKKVQINCKPVRSCKGCFVYKKYNKGENCVIKFEEDDCNIVKFINTSDYLFSNIIKKAFQIRPRCNFDYDILSVHSVEEIYMTEISPDRANNTVSRIGYCLNQSLECNTPYLLTCYSYPEPKSQKVVHIIIDAEKLKTNLDNFKLTKKDVNDLRDFNPLLNKKIKEPYEEDKSESVRIIYDFLEKLYENYSENITRIYKRFDLHMAIDLVFHSPLQFVFNNEFIHKGWLDVMIISDTRCGKGYVSENYIKYYGVGEVVSGENASFAGLVGGVTQANNRWIATWGKIPLNNKKLVVIDESGELEPKDFSRLSRIRSEGVAEITKIHTERTQAMTRLIFLTNPKNRLINSYSYGIEALQDLIESSEDISRFDYVLVLSQNEVDINEINKHRPVIENKYGDIDPTLIQWVWSRKANQIKFTDEATELILKYAVKLGKMYSPKIPLIQGENIRIKLAKISAAIAGRLFSHEKDNLVIKAPHVKASYVFLNLIYKKACSGYYYLSQIYKETQIIFDVENFEKYINTFENKHDLLHYFLNNNYITLSDVSEALNQPKEVAREVISKLIHHKCISKKYSFYIKNKCFNDWLRKY